MTQEDILIQCVLEKYACIELDHLTTHELNAVFNRFTSLIDRDEFLSCLEGAGVDNWEGYDVAQEIMNGQ